jgi:hypothetical protein
MTTWRIGPAERVHRPRAPVADWRSTNPLDRAIQPDALGWQSAVMGAVVELMDDEWNLVKHLFDPPVHRGIKGTIRADQVPVAIPPGPVPRLAGHVEPVATVADKGTWAAMMRVLAREIQPHHKRKADPTMVMIDGQTVKGGRAGPTFHEAGGRGGYTSGAKRTILIEILGLPLAAITSAVRLAGADYSLLDLATFSRHRSPAMVQRYYDVDRDVAGRIAERVSAAVEARLLG